MNTQPQNAENGEKKVIVKYYNTLDNKTVDIIQDTDKIVLTHNEAIELANSLLKLTKRESKSH